MAETFFRFFLRIFYRFYSLPKSFTEKSITYWVYIFDAILIVVYWFCGLVPGTQTQQKFWVMKPKFLGYPFFGADELEKKIKKRFFFQLASSFSLFFFFSHFLLVYFCHIFTETTKCSNFGLYVEFFHFLSTVLAKCSLKSWTFVVPSLISAARFGLLSVAKGLRKTVHGCLGEKDIACSSWPYLSDRKVFIDTQGFWNPVIMSCKYWLYPKRKQKILKNCVEVVYVGHILSYVRKNVAESFTDRWKFSRYLSFLVETSSFCSNVQPNDTTVTIASLVAC